MSTAHAVSSYDQFPCQVCQKLTFYKCRTCLKVSYCSREHQREDWPTHRLSTCQTHPVRIDRFGTDEFGSLHAARGFKRGQLILKERSLISGPYMTLARHNSTTTRRRICLACYRNMLATNSYICSLCQWPVCNASCEMASVHADFECKIFFARNVRPKKPGEDVDVYEMVTTLRALLLKQFDPAKWQTLQSIYYFDCYPEPTVKSAKQTEHENRVVEFIRTDCKMDDMDEELIKRTVTIITSNCRGNNSGKHPSCSRSYRRTASFLFYCLSSLQKSNIPNVTVRQTRISKTEIELEVYARADIEANEKLFQRISKSSRDRETIRTMQENLNDIIPQIRGLPFYGTVSVQQAPGIICLQHHPDINIDENGECRLDNDSDESDE